VTARRPSLRSRAADPRSRPVRGHPTETRRRLLAAAGVAFDRDGYEGTDSNRIAREAGYSPGTFYKHFPDKRAAFVAVYTEWVSHEWAAIRDVLADGRAPRDAARAVVTLVFELHRRWRGLRRSLRLLIGTDAEVRRVYLAERGRQLDTLARARRGRTTAADRADDALTLYQLERTADAVADGEPAVLGVDVDALIDRLVDRLTAYLT
jgi:AcrR family transcriptional regulator